MSRDKAQHFDELLEAWIDGEISPDERQELLASAADDPALGDKLAAASNLQQALAGLQTESVPNNISRALHRIPRRQKKRRSLKDWLLHPNWAVAAALVLFLVGGTQLYQQQQRQQQQQAQLAQAREELALVLAYLEKINRSANQQIQTTVSGVTSEPVTRITARTLQDQLRPKQELKL